MIAKYTPSKIAAGGLSSAITAQYDHQTIMRRFMISLIEYNLAQHSSAGVEGVTSVRASGATRRDARHHVP